MHGFYLLLLPIIALLIVKLFITGRDVKKVFFLPWYFIFIGGDIGNRKPVFLKKGCVVGVPDALFFDPIRFCFVVGELKTREYSSNITDYERAQVTLYSGLANKWYLGKSYSVISYASKQAIKVKFDKVLFKKIYKLRNKALNCINQFAHRR